MASGGLGSTDLFWLRASTSLMSVLLVFCGDGARFPFDLQCTSTRWVPLASLVAPGLKSVAQDSASFGLVLRHRASALARR